jgi:hypothetical protein
MRPDPPVAHEVESLAGAECMQRRRGERAAELHSVDCDSELCIAQIGILRHAEHQRVGSVAGGDGRRGRDRQTRWNALHVDAIEVEMGDIAANASRGGLCVGVGDLRCAGHYSILMTLLFAARARSRKPIL